MPGPLTQNISPTIGTTIDSGKYVGSSSTNINSNIGTVVASVTVYPPSGTSFPNAAVSVTPIASNSSGGTYSCSVNFGSTTSSTTSVLCIITIHANSGSTLPSPLTVGVSLSFGAGGGV